MFISVGLDMISRQLLHMANQRPRLKSTTRPPTHCYITATVTSQQSQTHQLSVCLPPCITHSVELYWKTYKHTYISIHILQGHISQLEAINCLVAIRLFVEAIHTGNTIEVQCDNSAAIAVYTSGKGKDPVILACARGIWRHVAALDCYFVFTYIPGVRMVTADTLSIGYVSQQLMPTKLSPSFETALFPDYTRMNSCLTVIFSVKQILYTITFYMRLLHVSKKHTDQGGGLH